MYVDEYVYVYVCAAGFQFMIIRLKIFDFRVVEIGKYSVEYLHFEFRIFIFLRLACEV